MYTVFAKEIADVDEKLFRRVGYFIGNVKALPINEDKIFAAKSISSHGSDDVQLQNLFFVTTNIELMTPVKEWMRPLWAYHRTDYPDDELFVELRYDYPLGLINITAFFLVHIEDCVFACKDEDDYCESTLDQLEQTGNFKWAAQ